MAKLDKNAPCSCGSGRKYKKCCGAPEVPEGAVATQPAAPAGVGANPLLAQMAAGKKPDFTPDQMAQVQQFSQMMQRLPKAQLQQIQRVMQGAMAGKDVSREAALLEKTLPPSFLEMAKNMQGGLGGMGGMGGMPAAPAAPVAPPSESDAKKIVREALAEGRISKEEAQKLLGEDLPEVSEVKPSGFKKWFKGSNK